MRLVKVSDGHYINVDLIIEIYRHLTEEVLTIVVAAPKADYSVETDPSLLKTYTIDLKGDVAENFLRWLDRVSEDVSSGRVLPGSAM
jgi:hypothetical protein